VILDAVLEDMTVRVIASAEVASERARDLLALGWAVEIRDEDGNLLEGAVAPPPSPPGEEEAPTVLPEDADLPSLPSGPDPTSLREAG
jgi:hypothetical protein